MTAPSQYALAGLCAALIIGYAGGCAGRTATTATPVGVSRVVAVESVYGDLVRQIGGERVAVTTILANADADPHAYEPSTSDADAVAAADLVVSNGLGCDGFVDKLLAASPRDGRTTIVAGSLAGHRLGDNPHVWYETATLRATARSVTSNLAARDPAHGARFTANRRRFDAWLDRLEARERAFARRHPHAAVAITEPVFDYVLHAVGALVATPPSFSHAIEEGGDPAPQDVATMDELLTNRRVEVFVYNRQTIEPATTRLLDAARRGRLPVVAVTETLPARERLQTWIGGELDALDAALNGR